MQEVIDIKQKKEWEEHTRQIPVPFCKWEYSKAFSYMGRPKLFVCGNKKDFIIMPFILRKIKKTSRLDITSPYGYSGPVKFGSPEKAEFNEAFEKYLIDNKIVSYFLRFNPMLRNRKLHQHSDTAGESVYISLDDYPECASKACRNSIARAERDTIWVESLIGSDASRLPVASPKSYIRKFMRLYYNTMKRKKADKRYFFPEDALKRIARMEGTIIFFAFRAPDPEPIAASMFLSAGCKTAYYFLSGSDHPCKPGLSNLILHGAAKFFKEAGVKRLCLGEGYSGQDSLFKFKASFSDLRAEHFVLKSTLDIMKYQELSVGKKGDFFPLYRSGDDLK